MNKVLFLVLAHMWYVGSLGAQNDVPLIFEDGDRFVAKKAVTDSTFVLQWGDGNVVRMADDMIFDEAVDLVPSWSFPFGVALEATCGSGCWYALILPFDEESPHAIRKYPVAYNIDEELVIYIGEGDTLVYVEDYRSHTITPVIVEQRCGSLFNGDCLIDADFRDEDIVYVQWYDSPKLDSSDELEIKIKRAE